MIPVEQILDYGIVAVALWMMYSIAYNKLTVIEDRLTEIRDILSKTT